MPFSRRTLKALALARLSRGTRPPCGWKQCLPASRGCPQTSKHGCSRARPCRSTRCCTMRSGTRCGADSGTHSSARVIKPDEPPRSWRSVAHLTVMRVVTKQSLRVVTGRDRAGSSYRGHVAELSREQFDSIEFDAAASGEHAAAARTMTELATAADEETGMPRAEALLRAGEQWLLADRPAEAVTGLRSALAHAGPGFVDPLVPLARPYSS